MKKEEIKEIKEIYEKILAASMWKQYWLAPADAKSSTHFSGSDTIKWQSINALHHKLNELIYSVCFLRHFTIGAPNVMFGTKCLVKFDKNKKIPILINKKIIKIP